MSSSELIFGALEIGSSVCLNFLSRHNELWFCSPGWSCLLPFLRFTNLLDFRRNAPSVLGYSFLLKFHLLLTIFIDYEGECLEAVVASLESDEKLDYFTL